MFSNPDKQLWPQLQITNRPMNDLRIFQLWLLICIHCISDTTYMIQAILRMYLVEVATLSFSCN